MELQNTKFAICEKGHKTRHSGSIAKGSKKGVQIPKYCIGGTKRSCNAKIINIIEG